MIDFITAALPWVVLGIAVAICASTFRKNADEKKEKLNNLQQNTLKDKNVPNQIEENKSDDPSLEEEENYMTTGMCLGMCFGVAASSACKFNISYGVSFGLLIGMIVGMNIKK